MILSPRFPEGIENLLGVLVAKGGRMVETREQ